MDDNILGITFEKEYYSIDQCRNGLPQWFYDMMKNVGKKCIVCGQHKALIFLGMSETNEDYYYILKDTDGRKILSSAVGMIKFVE